MIQIKRILVPVDFSRFSKHALSYGCAFAEEFDAELHLLHVLEDIVPEVGATLPVPEACFEELMVNAERALQELPGDLWTGGKSIVRSTRSGSPFFEILRYARDNEIDLIVLGTHGRTGLIGWIIGSVAKRVVRKAPCPVLTVRDPEREFVSSCDVLPAQDKARSDPSGENHS